MRPKFFRSIGVGLVVLLSGCTLPFSLPPPSDDTFKMDDPAPNTDMPPWKRQSLADLVRCANEGDMHAEARLGEMYLNGDEGAEKDPNFAVLWFSKAAKQGLAFAEVQMGHFYRDGLGVVKSIPQAVYWYESAADQGDTTAMLALGDLYKRGWYGIPADFKKSYEWYYKAACLGSFEAEYRIAWLLVRGVKGEPGVTRGIEILTDSANQGNTEALSELGDMYLEGDTVPKDVGRAMEYYQTATTRGSAEAAFKLGMIYDMGQDIEGDHEKAIPWFLMAAERGYPAAQLYVANIYKDGWGVPRDYQAAAKWYAMAAENGVVSAETELGDLYHAGKGVSRNLQAAARHYLTAAEFSNQPYAELMLSVLYQMGRGVPQDMTKSVRWYQKASKESGFALAEYQIARRYATGFGLPKDLREAYRWYLYAADEGLAVAEVELAEMFYKGQGVDQSLEDAFQWYYKAAKQNHPYAQYRVGVMLLQGEGIPQNLNVGALWVRKAAYQGDKAAQYQLGLLYLDGTGVDQDDVYAYGWLKIALEKQTDLTPAVLVNLVDGNHPSALEDIGMPALFNARFLAKEQIKDWWILGRISTAAGTLYVKREAKQSRKQAGEALIQTLLAGHNIGLYPEGGCKGRRLFLPFRYGCFEAAIKTGIPIIPVFLHYEAQESFEWLDNQTLLQKIWTILKSQNKTANYYVFDSILPKQFENKESLCDYVEHLYLKWQTQYLE